MSIGTETASIPAAADREPEPHHAHLGRVAQDVWRYGAGMAASKVLAVLTLPIATHLFAPADFGVIELLTSVATLLTTVCLFGVDSAMEALYLDPAYADERPTLVSTGLWFLVSTSVVALIASVIFSGPISKLTFGEGDHRALLVVATVIAAFGALSKYGSYIVRLQFRPWAVTLINFFTGVGGVLIALALVQVAGASVGVWQFGLMLGGAVALVISLFKVRSELMLTFSVPLLRRIFPLAYPFFASSLVAVLAATVERYLLAGLSSVDQVGLYAVAARLSSYLATGLSSISLAWAPMALKIYYDNDRFEATYRKGLTYFMVGGSFLAIGLTAFSPEVVRLLAANAYAGATVAVGALCIAVVAGTVHLITTVGLILQKRAGLVFGIGTLSLIVNVLVSLLLIPRIGMLGAAIATAAGQIAFAWCSYLMTERLLKPFTFDGRAAALVALTSIGYVACLTWMTVVGRSSVPMAALRGGLWLSFVPALAMMRVITRDDLRDLVVVARHVVGRD